jgi:hypothetical protein
VREDGVEDEIGYLDHGVEQLQREIAEKEKKTHVMSKYILKW